YETAEFNTTTCSWDISGTQPADSKTIVNVCDSYTWSVTGQTYTQSGVYTSFENCQNNVLELTIVESTSEVQSVTAVGSYLWSLNQIEYTQSGNYSIVLGCITYHLQLTITPPVQPCTYQTYSQGGWSNANSPLTTAFLQHHFPNGLVIGKPGRSITLNSVSAIRNFLPNSGTPDRLASGNQLNPNNKKVKNVFAGQLVALLLNVAANPGMENATLVTNNLYNGKTIAWLINEAQAKIGSSTALNSTIYSQLSDACEAVNLSFHNGNTGYVDCTQSIRRDNVQPKTDSFSDELLNTIVIYPNPSRNQFMIHNPFSTEIRFNIYNLSGQLIEERNSKAANSSFEFGETYPCGVYLVEITIGSAQKIVKLVKY
ncbi:T9SS type A sorting domain-containing protein, partial [Flavobacterium sp.]|uniref:T9SS type A sorting domain-containing protein n=1 Tax=Flavobacterium sp. TaxID=239 RepID=UPI002FDA6A13